MDHSEAQFDSTPDLPDIAWKVAKLLVAHHGASLEALATLHWSDVVFLEQYGALAEALIRLKKRTVATAVQVSQALRAWRVQQEILAETNDAIRAAIANPETAYVFLDRRGRPVKPATLAKRLKWIRAARITAVMHQLHVVEPGSAPVSHPTDCTVCACSEESTVNLQRLADLLEERYHSRIRSLV
jgi:hypothetical protein